MGKDSVDALVERMIEDQRNDRIREQLMEHFEARDAADKRWIFTFDWLPFLLPAPWLFFRRFFGLGVAYMVLTLPLLMIDGIGDLMPSSPIGFGYLITLLTVGLFLAGFSRSMVLNRFEKMAKGIDHLKGQKARKAEERVIKKSRGSFLWAIILPIILPSIIAFILMIITGAIIDARQAG